MTTYRQAAGKAVEHHTTKYDECVIKGTGKPYRHQKGSGRSEVLALAKDGMKLGQLTKLAAQQGFDPKFTVSAVLKHITSTDNAYDLVPPAGTTLKDIKGKREPRRLSPEQQAKREAKEKEKAEKAKAREEAKAKKAAEKEAAAKKKAAEAEAKKAEAKKVAEAAKKKAA